MILRLWSVAALALWLPGSPVASAAGPDVAVCDSASLGRQVVSFDGYPLYIAHYRPPAPASLGVLLVHDWGSRGNECWGQFPAKLCAQGFEVIVPDLRAHGASVLPEMLHPLRALPSRVDLNLMQDDVACWVSAFSDAVREVVMVAVGWGGCALPDPLSGARQLSAVAWIAPRGDPDAFEWRPVSASPVRLLLLAARGDAEGSRVAETLFGRFNAAAELRIFSNGDAGCGLATTEWMQGGLTEWLLALRSAPR